MKARVIRLSLFCLCGFCMPKFPLFLVVTITPQIRMLKNSVVNIITLLSCQDLIERGSEFHGMNSKELSFMIQGHKPSSWILNPIKGGNACIHEQIID